MSDNNFRISGIPDNEEFEVPDNRPKTKSISAKDIKELRNMSAKDMEEVQKMLPPEILSFMDAAGIDFSKMFSDVNNMLTNMNDEQIENMCQKMVMMDPDDLLGCMNCDDSESDDISDINTIYGAGQPKYLAADEFGSVEMYSSENLYDEFVERYGTDSTLYLDDNIGIRDFILNEITAKINIDSIKNMRLVNSNENYILFYMEPKNENEYGFFSAVVKKGEGNFALYVPTYCNTFHIIEDEQGNFKNIVLYNSTDDEDVFISEPSDITSFKFLSANLIEMSISFALAPKKNTLLTPTEFGTIKNTRASVNADSSMLPIGKITSNGSTNSILLLKDAELPLDKENYNLFIKFPTVINENALRFISAIFYDVDFNQCPLMENVELKYTPDGKLYFDIDHFRDF